MTLRGLFRFKDADATGRQPIPIEEVEPVSEIVKRFSTGAMSYGSISREAHENLAIAMNRLGAKSNTGEGGEDTDRLRDPERRSSIKQVASGRFGVTSDYLTNADDLQIKMAQGAKPGEGGQLPGAKVYPWVAKTRYSTPGVGLISPPPHHDIYSIEDLAQLIHDLKNANPSARVHVKLVAEVGVGTVAAGVSKAHADVVLISGHDGGTGAAPLTSLKHAGGPWELGLAETQQTLLVNGLRDRIVVQTDGQLKTGRDVVIAALLGAEEYGFATAPLVVSGCIMMRVCHLDTCPVGVATQNPVLRQRFNGKPEFVVTFFEYIAEEVREILAELGFRTLDEAIGRVGALDVAPAVDHWKAAGLDLTPILHVAEVGEQFAGQDLRCTKTQDHGLEKALDNELIRIAAPALERGEPVRAQVAVRNVNRTVGTMLGHEVTKRYAGDGLPARHDRPDPGRLGRPVVRRVPPARHHAPARGRCQRLRRQGPVGRPDRDPSRPVGDLRRPRADHRRERDLLRRHVGRGLHPGRRRRTLLRPQLRCDRGRRGRGRPRLRVHDRRSRARARQDRPELRGRHERRYGVRPRPQDPPGQPRARRPRPGAGRRRGRAPRAGRAPPGGDGLDAWPRPCWPTGRAPSPASPKSCRATTDGSCEARAAGRARGPRRRRDRLRGSWRCSMADPRGFLKHGREVAERRPVEERVHDWNEVYPGGPGRALLPIISTQASRCMDCGIPFCHEGCPLGNLIPEWNDLVWRDDWDGAMDRLHATNNFPEFTGRLCPAPCETACVLGINQDPVTIKNVEVAIIDRAWSSGYVRPRPPEWLSGRTVAVIGSGPGRPRRRPAAHPCRSHRRGLRAGRQDRRPAALRHPRVQDGEGGPRPPARPDEARGHGLPRRRRRRCRADRRAAPGAVRRRRARRRVDRRPRAAGARTRARRDPPGDGVPPAVQPRLARPGGAGADHRRRPRRRDHRRWRHRRRLPRYGDPAGRDVRHPAGDPGPAAGAATRTTSPGPPIR